MAKPNHRKWTSKDSFDTAPSSITAARAMTAPASKVRASEMHAVAGKITGAVKPDGNFNVTHGSQPADVRKGADVPMTVKIDGSLKSDGKTDVTR